MKNICLVIQYDGSNFFGMQKQQDKRTIQGVLEEVLSSFFKEKVEIMYSGRTDAGVHALRQYVNFFIDTKMDIQRLPFALNILLPEDLKVLEAREVEKEFSSRFSAKNKTYEYLVLVSPHRLPLYSKNYHIIPFDLDLEKMKEVAKMFEGEHSFESFCSKGSEVNSYVRTINFLEIIKNNNEYKFVINGNGFLYNMVRTIVGTLIEVGRNKISKEDVSNALNIYNKSKVGKVVPANALYLKDVIY